jgi:AcrR family transcriptional regulator
MAAGRPRAFDIDAAADRAMEVFWRKGYEGASMADLTTAMGIGSPSLYAAFGSKEGLFRAALDRYAANRSDLIAEVLGAKTARDSAEAMLRGTAERYFIPGQPPGCMLLQGGMACGAGHESIPAELARRRADVESLLRERFERGQAEGDLDPAADPAALARYVAMVTQGMGVQAAAGATLSQLLELAEMALAAWPKDPQPVPAPAPPQVR